MAGLLDYYKENPDLWAENEYLLQKDPAYDLGMMDLDVMDFKERERGRWHRPNAVARFFGDQPAFRHYRSGVLGSYNQFPETKKGIPSGDIALYTGPFTEGNTPTYWDNPDIGNPPSEMRNKPIFNLDKARVMAHEARHKQTTENPELYEAQPDWTGLYAQSDDPDPDEQRIAKDIHWRNEVFNRFMDFKYFPDWQFRGRSATVYPRGLSSPDLKPEDMYFDKIWRDHWEPYAKNYEKIQKKIAERRNVPGTPIVPMGVGRGRDEPSGADLSPGGGYGQSPTGSDIAGTPFSRGGILGAF